MASASDGNLHRGIKALLIERFQAAPLNVRLPSVRTLAEELDVAYLTVNGVMKELEWEGYVKRIPRQGTYLASRQRTLKRDMQTGAARLQTIVFAYPNHFSYATWLRLHHAEERAVRCGLALVEYKMNAPSCYTGLRELVGSRDDVLGVMLIPVPGTVGRPEIALLDALGVPVVLLSPCELVSLADGVWSVTTDDREAGRLMAEHLLLAGHERIAYIRHEPASSDRQQALLAGMRRALREAERDERDLIVMGGSTQPWRDSRVAAEHLTRDLIRDGQATAAIYESLLGVQGGLKAARRAGLRVPADLAVIATGQGNGDEAYFHPPIPTIDTQPDREIELAYRCILNPQQHESRWQTIPPRLAERASVAPNTRREAFAGLHP